jgi:hypothetical protein
MKTTGRETDSDEKLTDKKTIGPNLRPEPSENCQLSGGEPLLNQGRVSKHEEKQGVRSRGLEARANERL